MRRFFGFVFAACLLATGTSASAQATNPPDWPKTLTLGSASPGGVNYDYSEALAKILSESLKIPVNPLPTQGPVHNVKLIESGGAQLGTTTTGIALQGWNGTGDWTAGQRNRKMRALFPMYDQPFQFVALRRSGITTVAQFSNRNVGVGPRAGTAGTYVPAMFGVIGISAKIGNGSWDAAAADLLEGRYDALGSSSGVPIPALKQVEAKEPAIFVSLTPEQIEAIRKAMPELTISQIGSGAYTSLDKTYTTVGLYIFAIGRDDLPDELVYQLVKATFVNHDRLLKAIPAAADTLPKNVDKNTFLPFHPGAVRYYREIGIKIPDALVPTN
jgi:TRAP transporter TAXI family solute receptor